MEKRTVLNTLFFYAILHICNAASAQVETPDTFFLAKKKGILGRLGRSVSRTPEVEPVKIANPFLPYAGKKIRTIEILPLRFNQNLDDTSRMKTSFAIRVARKLHTNSRTSVIRNHLFFHEGDVFVPLLVSDNETYLREQPFLQDALIVVKNSSDTSDFIDITVLTRDVFSIGGRINVNTSRVRTEVREENVAGSGHEISVSAIYDKDRAPHTGAGADFFLRNIGGSFLDISGGYTNFQKTYNSPRFEESMVYARLSKPFVNRYTQWTANAELSYNRTSNAYDIDSLYRYDIQYKFSNIDLWAGYNIGYKSQKGKDSQKRLRHFVAGRTFYHKFDHVPEKFATGYNYNYADINGLLFSYTLYRQNFYRTNFIYAFGRNEDVPVGLSASLIAGWANTQDQRRPYYALEFEGTRLSQKKIFSAYAFKFGGFYNRGKMEDINFLLSINHFTRLVKLGSKWLNRNFIGFSFTRQFQYRLNQPLFLKSEYGLPYFANDTLGRDERITVKIETDFYNLNKVFGFRLAPFAFTDFSLLKPTNQRFAKSDGYTAIGAGIRARNENLVFETIELRGYYFPNTFEGTKNFKVDLVTKVRFRFNSTFVRKPDFIFPN